MPRPLRRIVLPLAAGFVLLLLVSPYAVHYLEANAAPGEAVRLAAEVGVRPGMTVAEIGAGDGRLAVEMARLLGTRGQMIATELGDRQQQAIRDAATRARLSNLTVVAAGEHETHLPAGCCDAIYMQRVYHHLADPAAVIGSARRALKTDGTLALMEFEPNVLRNLFAPRGIPRKGHGVTKETLVGEMQAFGFRLRNRLSAWPDGMYLAIFMPATAGPVTRPREARRAFALYAD